MPPRARVAKATAPKVETPAEAVAVPADVDPFTLTSTGLAGLGEPLDADSEPTPEQTARDSGSLSDADRAELEGYRALFADSGLAQTSLLDAEKAPAEEGPVCRIHHPGGWPEGQSGATCDHGTFWRWGKPSALERSGQTVMDPTTDDWSDRDV